MAKHCKRLDAGYAFLLCIGAVKDKRRAINVRIGSHFTKPARTALRAGNVKRLFPLRLIRLHEPKRLVAVLCLFLSLNEFPP